MKLRQFFEDGTGALSMMRVTQAIVVGAVLAVFAIANVAAVVTSVVHNTWPAAIIDIPVQCVGLIALVIAGKVVQAATAERAERAETVGEK